MSELRQLKCPRCDEYRRCFNSGHGIIVHLFYDHKMSGDEIQALLLDSEANGYGKPIEIMGRAPLPPDWWDRCLDGEG